MARMKVSPLGMLQLRQGTQRTKSFLLEKAGPQRHSADYHK